MSIAQSLPPEFDHEMANTRRTLERVPDAKFGYKPHPKSMSMGGLATHIGQIVYWAEETLKSDSFDVAPGGKPVAMLRPASTAEILRAFDTRLPQARAALIGTSDEAMMRPWSLLHAGQTIFTMPRIATLRSFVFNHMVHHRGQLTVYLRLNDVPVPALYGPSADER